MRVQHNIMAMNAYRNYNNNTKALSGNLEKLSSGYKINRAGDDAAGLAISEKMRSQITGLDAAQKNVKDGISLVKTAEGALQEVQDMIKRMKYLATQSANGTYDLGVDRQNLQKEVVSLREEIDRIAKSANFNGIKLLDGSLDNGSTTLEKIKSWAGTQGAGGSVGTDSTGSGTGSTATTAYTPAVAAATPTATGLEKDKVVASGAVLKVTGSAASAVASIAFGSASLASKAATLASKSITLTFGSGTNKFEVTVKFVASAGSDTSAIVVASDTKGSAVLQAIKNIVTAAASNVLAGADAKALSAENISITAGSNGKGLKGSADIISLKASETKGPGSVATNASVVRAGATAEIDLSKVITSGKNFQAGDTVKIGDVTYKFGTAETHTVDFASGAASLASKGVDAKFSGLSGDIKKITFTVASGTTSKASVAVTASGGLTIKLSYASGTKAFASGAAAVKAINDALKAAAGSGSAAAVASAAKKVQFTGTIDMSKLGAVSANGTVSEVSKEASVTAASGTVTVALGSTQAKSIQNLVDAINANKDDTGISAKLDGKTLTLTTTKDFASAEEFKKAITAKVTSNDTDLQKAFQEAWDAGVKEAVDALTKKSGGLILQIGDTSDEFNQLTVGIADMKSAAMELDQVDISTQQGAQKAIEIITNATNYVSSVRGDLGAIQNRLEHTANNLSVMAENIQDAESTIRDTDVADEMMKYVKNNILIQSAQAMLAQANQIPQGVLQLLG